MAIKYLQLHTVLYIVVTTLATVAKKVALYLKSFVAGVFDVAALLLFLSRKRKESLTGLVILDRYEVWRKEPSAGCFLHALLSCDSV